MIASTAASVPRSILACLELATAPVPLLNLEARHVRLLTLYQECCRTYRAPVDVYLAGHRLGYAGTPARMIFYRLPDLQTGDKVLLKGPEGKIYRYAVSERYTVSPRTAWPVQPVRNRDMVTLQTCVGPGYGQRLIVRADRI